jgi:deoxyribose-phosphate aldolase
MLLSGEWEEVECDLRSTILSAGSRPVGVIIEAAYLNDPQLQRVCALALETGVESICAASGWLPILPNVACLQRMQALLAGNAQLETAGISSYDQFVTAYQAGVERFMLRYQHAEAILAQIS